MCLLSSTFLSTTSGFKEDPAQSVASPPSEEEGEGPSREPEDEDVGKTKVEDKNVVNVELPPTPPLTQGDCQEFNPDQELKKDSLDVCEESPLKGYRRVLARNGGRWVLQFVSPEGLRFESQDELASYVCQKRPDIDPGDWKKLDLHFLRHSTDERPVQAQRKVQFSFCNMRQNIFDLKRKRGGKRKDFRRNSIAVIPAPPPIPSSLPEVPQVHPESQQSINIQTESSAKIAEPQSVVQRAESCDDSLLLQNCHETELKGALSTQPTLVEASEPPEDESITKQPESEHPPTPSPLILHEDEELVVISKDRDCQVQMLDMFATTPLSSFECSGCNGKYCGRNDSFTIDLKLQTLSVVCGNCLWWTQRKITTRLKSV